MRSLAPIAQTAKSTLNVQSRHTKAEASSANAFTILNTTKLSTSEPRSLLG